MHWINFVQFKHLNEEFIVHVILSVVKPMSFNQIWHLTQVLLQNLRHTYWNLVSFRGGEAPLKLTRFQQTRRKFCNKTCIKMSNLVKWHWFDNTQNHVYNEFFIEMFELHEVDSMHCYSVIPTYIWVAISKAFHTNILKHVTEWNPLWGSKGVSQGDPPPKAETERVSLLIATTVQTISSLCSYIQWELRSTEDWTAFRQVAAIVYCSLL